MPSKLMAAPLFNRYARLEMARLDEKARLMEAGLLDERAAASDAEWARRNDLIFQQAEAAERGKA